MRLLATICIAAPPLIALAWSLPAPAAPAGDGVCAAGQVPVVWPVGKKRFEPRPLLDSHGQYLQFDTYPPYTHRGIDIDACEGDFVYAVEAGIVDFYKDDAGAGYGYLYVRDADGDTDETGSPLGWKYQHLSDIQVFEGEVLRDQYLGRIAKFPEDTDFDHLHLQRVVADGSDETLDNFSKDAGSPFLWMPSKADDKGPARVPFDAPHSTDARFLYYQVGGTAGAVETPVTGVKYEVVARVREVFSGSGPLTCSKSACAKTSKAPIVMPMRLSFEIFREYEDDSGDGPPRKRVESALHNVIDLSKAILDEEALATNIYRDGSEGGYDERVFLVDVTHCQSNGNGSFEFEDESEYFLQLVLEDSSGNAKPIIDRLSFP